LTMPEDSSQVRPSRRAEEKGREIGRKAERKIRAIREGDRSVWFGLGMFGIVGWSVAIPTVLLTALGVWLDSVYPVGFSWTLTLMVVGVAIGSANAWYWIKKATGG